MQGNNIDDELRAQNPSLPNVNSNVIKLQDVNGRRWRSDQEGSALVLRARYRNNRTDQYGPGCVLQPEREHSAVAALALDALRARLSISAPSTTRVSARRSIRVTWQATQKNKFTFSYSQQYRENNYNGGGTFTGGTTITSPEAGEHDGRPAADAAAGELVESPRTNRLLLEGSFSAFRAFTGGQAGLPTTAACHAHHANQQQRLPRDPAGQRHHHHRRAAVEQQPQLQPALARLGGAIRRRDTACASVTTGFYSKQTLEGPSRPARTACSSPSTELPARAASPSPPSTAIPTRPRPSRTTCSQTGLYVEDQWTLKRLTLQGALRFDRAVSGYPEQTYGPGLLVPTADHVSGGQGRAGVTTTSRRASARPTTCSATARRRSSSTGTTTSLRRRMTRRTRTTTRRRRSPTRRPARSWTDNEQRPASSTATSRNGAGAGAPGAPAVFRCVDTAPQSTSARSARPRRPRRVTDPSTLRGWNVRPSDYQVGFGVQQEVARGVSVELT